MTTKTITTPAGIRRLVDLFLSTRSLMINYNEGFAFGLDAGIASM